MPGDYDPFHVPAYNPGAAFKVSSPYGYREDPIETSRLTREPSQKKKPEFHSGQDYAAPAGTSIPSAASGAVVYSGFNKNLGNVVIVKNDRGDYSLYGHMQDGDRAQLGQRLEEGDRIGSVGETGARVKGVHLHYSVIRPEAGAIIGNGPGDGGSIGVHLDGFTTNDPVGLPRYLDQSRRAAEILSGLGETSPLNGTPPPNHSPFFNPFNQTTPAPAAAAPPSTPNGPLLVDRYTKWGSVPLPTAPVVSDDPADFAGRFGNWASSPAGVPDQGKRSEQDDTPVRVLSRVNLSGAPASGDAPSLSPAPPPRLPGIFSGKPMRDYPVWPAIFATDDRPSPDDDELNQRWRRWLDA